MTLKAQPAVVTLTMVLSLLFVGLLVVMFLVLSGVELLNQSRIGVDVQETRSVANACVQEAMVELAQDSGYTGENVSLDGVDCVIAVSGSGSTRTVDVEATQGTQIEQNFQVSVDMSVDPLEITNWEEL